MAVTVLVVSGDDSRSAVADAVRSHGFRTLEASDVGRALTYHHAYRPAAVIVDATLPGDGALDILRRIRSHADTPVVIVSHVSDEIDEVVALAAGADDFVVWPTSPRVLAARVTAILRRAGGSSVRDVSADRLEYDGLVVSRSARSATVNDVDLHLTRIEFELLLLLLERPDTVLRREEIARKVWADWSAADHVIEVHVSRLRAKVAKAGGPPIADAVRGVGYRLAGHAVAHEPA